jgi:NifU-like protein involved in Fe-S cluster formation
MESAPTSDYSEILLDHYNRPRNLGDLDEPDAVAIVHDDTCGDVVRMAVRLEPGAVDGDGSLRRIAEARFKAYGCAAAIASASVVTELLTGSTLGQAAAITETKLMDALGGLPPRRVHAAVLGREVVRALIRRLEQRG